MKKAVNIIFSIILAVVILMSFVTIAFNLFELGMAYAYQEKSKQVTKDWWNSLLGNSTPINPSNEEDIEENRSLKEAVLTEENDNDISLVTPVFPSTGTVIEQPSIGTVIEQPSTGIVLIPSYEADDFVFDLVESDSYTITNIIIAPYSYTSDFAMVSSKFETIAPRIAGVVKDILPQGLYNVVDVIVCITYILIQVSKLPITVAVIATIILIAHILSLVKSKKKEKELLVRRGTLSCVLSTAITVVVILSAILIIPVIIGTFSLYIPSFIEFFEVLGNIKNEMVPGLHIIYYLSSFATLVSKLVFIVMIALSTLVLALKCAIPSKNTATQDSKVMRIIIMIVLIIGLLSSFAFFLYQGYTFCSDLATVILTILIEEYVLYMEFLNVLQLAMVFSCTIIGLNLMVGIGLSIVKLAVRFKRPKVEGIVEELAPKAQKVEAS